MGMTIARLETENYRRWKFVNLEFPESGAIIFSGKNGVGKSGAGIDALIELLFRKGATTKTPIREGAEKATIKVILKEGGEFEYGDLDCKVELLDPDDRSKRRLTVKGKKGAKYGATTLSGLFGELTVDPSDFIRMLSRQRRDELLKAVTGLDIDLDKNTAQRKAVFDERTDVNRDVVRLTGQIQGMEIPEEGLPGEVQSSSDVLEMIAGVDGEISIVKKINEDIADTESGIGDIDNEIDELTSQIASLESAKKTAMSEREDAINSVAELKKQSVDAPTISSLNERRDSFKADLDNLEQTNEKIRAAQKYTETVAELTETQEKAQKLTAKIDSFDKAKFDALAKAVFPLPELSLDGDEVMFDSLPFDDACTSIQYKIVCAIAMAQNPDADFIFMRNGGILDLDNLKGLNDYAIEKKFQVFVEYVSDDPKSAPGIYIEEGVDELTNVEDKENEI